MRKGAMLPGEVLPDHYAYYRIKAPKSKSSRLDLRTSTQRSSSCSHSLGSVALTITGPLM